jgi:tetratricopeptide (TPR) repeat protein
MKALEKDRNRRYGSPAELVADVRRHLADEPVQAGPPSAVYRARKFVRRHRLGVAVAATALVALLATTVGTSYGLFRALAAEREARDNAETAERVSDFLVGLFEVTDPNVRQGRELTAREVFDAGAEKVESELADEPLLRARMLRTFGAVYLNLGLMEEAERNLGEAIEIERALSAKRAEARTAEVLAHTLLQRGNEEEAERIAQRAIGLWSELGTEDDPALAQAHIVLGYIHLYRREVPEEAEPHLRRALEILGSNPRSKPTTILSVRGSLAAIPWYRGDVEGFAQGAQEAVDYARANGIGDTIIGNVMKRWTGHGPWLRGQLDEAERITRQALDRQLELIGGDSTVTLDSRWDLLSLVQAQGRHSEVAEMGSELVAACERLFGPTDRETVAAMALTAEALRRAGRVPEAIVMLEKVRGRALEGGQPESETNAVVDCYLTLAETAEDPGAGLEATLSTCADRLASMEVSHSNSSARLSLSHRARLDLARAAADHGLSVLAIRILGALVDGGYRDPLLHRRGFAALEDHPEFQALVRQSSSQP